MNRFTVAVITLLLAVGGLVACPAVAVVHNKAVVVSTPYVEPVYPSVATTTVAVRIDLAQYSAYLAPAIAVPYVQPPVPAAALVTQTPTVAVAAPAVVAAAAPCPAMPAAALSSDQCSQILAELRGMKADIAALKQGQTLPPPVAPAAFSKKPIAAIVTNCAACHTTGKPYTDPAGKAAPSLFDAAGLSTMTVGQIVKARHKVKDSKMPPPDSPQAKAATPESLNETLEGLDALEEATVETKPTP